MTKHKDYTIILKNNYDSADEAKIFMISYHYNIFNFQKEKILTESWQLSFLTQLA